MINVVSDNLPEDSNIALGNYPIDSNKPPQDEKADLVTNNSRNVKAAESEKIPIL